ncbi:inositol monophosphatase [Desulfovibrio sp. X2]|uniref:inositol monophosphatase family protein n=1 Tax=Desulfovibrio sp. X2 TaxID=941449 RepID=UPI000358BA89|nr:inositol monophosphatase family protein [Desulfovibrio sp. X2]EPR42307.1 inositol monophosphatase [Desulfovibrio sp. X2]
MEYEGLLDGLLAVSRSAGEVVRQDWSGAREITKKGRIDLVTQTDMRVEELLREKLGALLPEAAFYGEESSDGKGPGELAWIVDPVDGTTNFAHSIPFVAVSVALWADGRPVLAAVNAPMLDELYHAARGRGAFCNGAPMRVSDCAKLVDGIVATGFPYAIERYVDRILAHMRRMLLATQGVRRPGAAAIDMAFVAAGRYDGFYEYGLKPWDTAAGWLLVEEAGGRVSSMDAAKPYLLGAENILASNGLLHEALSEILRKDLEPGRPG